MIEFLKRLFLRDSSAGPAASPAPPRPRPSGPHGTDDPRQGGRGPHDPVPPRHDEVLYALLFVLRSNMGKDRVRPLEQVIDVAGFWGFDGPRLEAMFAGRSSLIEIEDLVARLRNEFSPHDFEKTVAVLVTALGSEEMDGVSLRMFADMARASGHGADTFVHYLDEGARMQRLMFGR